MALRFVFGKTRSTGNAPCVHAEWYKIRHRFSLKIGSRSIRIRFLIAIVIAIEKKLKSD
jgi:hypothetical protein